MEEDRLCCGCLPAPSPPPPSMGQLLWSWCTTLCARFIMKPKFGAKNPRPYLKCCVPLFLYHLLCVFTSFTPWKVCTHPKLRTKLAGAPLGASQQLVLAVSTSAAALLAGNSLTQWVKRFPRGNLPSCLSPDNTREVSGPHDDNGSETFEIIKTP